MAANDGALAADAALNAVNTTETWYALLPSEPRDILLFPFRLVYHAEVFIITLPRQLVRFIGLDAAISSVLDSTARVFGVEGGDAAGEDAAAAAAVIAAMTGTDANGALPGGAAAGSAASAGTTSGFSIGGFIPSLKKFGGFFNYMTTRWSLACFIVALVLNRVTVYASPRRQVTLKWHTTLILRIIPIILFATQILQLLRAIRCQTSPQYSAFRYDQPGKHSRLDYAGEGGFLYNISSSLLQWEDEQSSCSATFTSPGPGVTYGSFSLLWPAFLRLCFGHFIDTLSAALQGKPLATEGGMSVFELSLAFAEAEIQIVRSVGLDFLGITKSTASVSVEGAAVGDAASAIPLFSKDRILERLNVTPELLVIALLACCNSLTTNILDIFGKQSQYRLINTSFWGLSFMGFMIWSFLRSYLDGNHAGLLNFPTVCIVGFVPHLLMLLGILTCLTIYTIALLLTAYSLPPSLPRPNSFRERLAIAHGNMQSSTQIQNTRFQVHDDFYATLVRIGYASLSAASDAVFLNEGKSVKVRKMTWLEEDRLAEFTARRGQSSQVSFQPVDDLQLDENFDFDIPSNPREWESGYGKEKKFERAQSSSHAMKKQSGLGNVGAFRGPTRCYHGFAFFKAILYMLAGWWAFGLVRLLDHFKVGLKPQWLVHLAGVLQHPNSSNEVEIRPPLDFWILTDEGVLELPETDDFDVEKEMRKREMMVNDLWDEQQEEHLDNKLYNWWKFGGSWGNQDMTEDYSPPPQDWDTTSVVSTSTSGETEWESYDSDGRRTPTQSNPFPGLSRVPERRSTWYLWLACSIRRWWKHEMRLASYLAHILASNEGKIMTRRRFPTTVRRRACENSDFVECISASGRTAINPPYDGRGVGNPRKPDP
ncbi:hypothetical protein MGYG_00004 [Nannizzia gypsea CBS 118893]|uniref:Ubiquitin-protein ligase n=1 Tax=Arthroderma gypseum (strain ATCC MYA-4604 / CBS 118893) TaxID=535722 RepID=E5R1W7_ARTGP|nr:hypothetical protein MGYG_00004 [Nannizzia gypsea CBS 118893]EFQ96960.1 hypothetical protein MGYG_00004 [Nannizzia gypsea CBS 118893]